MKVTEQNFVNPKGQSFWQYEYINKGIRYGSINSARRLTMRKIKDEFQINSLGAFELKEQVIVQ